MRTLGYTLAAASLALVAAGAQAPAPTPTPSAAGQKPAARPAGKPTGIPRTPDGKPDFHGNWTNATITPLERLGQGRPLVITEHDHDRN